MPTARPSPELLAEIEKLKAREVKVNRPDLEASGSPHLPKLPSDSLTTTTLRTRLPQTEPPRLNPSPSQPIPRQPSKKKTSPPKTPEQPGSSNRPPFRKKYANKRLFLTPAGELVGEEYKGEKTKVADSKKEYRRLLQLIGLQNGGHISNLQRNRPFLLRGENGEVLARYRADFVYIVAGHLVVEDVKSAPTRKLAMYRLKKRWMFSQFKIRILET